MKKWSITMWITIFIANIMWAFMFISVSYSWGYDQYAIDHDIAYFSAPAYINLLNGIPFLLGAILFIILAIVCYKKGSK